MNGTRALSEQIVPPTAQCVGGVSRVSCLLLVSLSGLALCLMACTRPNTNVEVSAPDAAATQLMLPSRIEIHRDWTKPISLEGKPAPDAMEVIVAAYDSCNDSTKMLGTLHIELYTRRPASSDKMGKRIAFWAVEMNSIEQMTEHWDSLARFYRFPLKLAAPPLTPGRYVLTATLQPPCGDRLSDEYDFEHGLEATAQRGLGHNGAAEKGAAGKKSRVPPIPGLRG